MYQEKAFELHTHLYGCLNEDDLRWLASRKQPRWHIFEQSYRSAYNASPNLENIFAPERRSDLRKLSIYESVGNFPEFQCCFDFVISVAHADPEEVHEVASRLSKRQVEPHAEYRMLFGPQIEMDDYLNRVQSICEGFESTGKESYLAMSLWRGGDLAWKQYRALRELMQKSTAVARRLVAVDFCAAEEGFPPVAKESLFQEILENNALAPETALAILYHVGESFQDKTLESAARWVYQSAAQGAHRLGHAIALGQEPAEFRNDVRHESISERLDQLQFELDTGLTISLPDSKYAEEMERLDEMQHTDPDATVAVEYTDAHIAKVRYFQDSLMDRIAKTNAVIEVCPTSNYRIAAVRQHPVHRFVSRGLPIIVGADDPGIFDTNLEKEFEILKKEGLSVDELIEQSRRSSSARLSGRE
ncbi:MAG: hypothetical protein KDK33_07010 [Leptospiraceae bacterium]|nr:hypothetical protein [Leptospiraceae bacterium]